MLSLMSCTTLDAEVRALARQVKELDAQPTGPPISLFQPESRIETDCNMSANSIEVETEPTTRLDMDAEVGLSLSSISCRDIK